MFDPEEYAKQMVQSHINRGNFFSTMVYTSYVSKQVVYLQQESYLFFHRISTDGVIIQTASQYGDEILYFHFKVTYGHLFVAINTGTYSVYLHVFCPEKEGMEMTPPIDTLQLLKVEEQKLSNWVEACKTYIKETPKHRLLFLTGQACFQDKSAQDALNIRKKGRGCL